MKRTIIISGSVVVLVLILAGAAYAGAQMLSQAAAPAAVSGGGGRRMEMIVEKDDGNGATAIGVSIIVLPAESLPNRPSEAGGVLLRREDNTIIVGTGDIELNVDVDGNTGQRQVSLTSNGPEIEVVITANSNLYEDVTDMEIDPESIPASGEVQLQQEIAPLDSLESLGENVEVEVWGSRSGDRITAEIVVFRDVSGNF